MSSDAARQQLEALAEVGRLLERRRIEWWLFGGLAVDFHVGEVKREHADVDLAVRLDDAETAGALLLAAGWRHAPAAGEDGGTGYERGSARVELTYITSDAAGRVLVALRSGSVLWSEHPLGSDVRELLGVRARVIPLELLRRGKRSPRDDPGDAENDRADLQALAALDEAKT